MAKKASKSASRRGSIPPAGVQIGKSGVRPYRYDWGHDRHPPIPAEVAGREFESIYRAEGRLLPEVVVRRAESPRSPLHGAFEWDDTVAARRYRLRQASSMISAITVTVVRENPEDEKPETVFVSVRRENDEKNRREYTTAFKALSDADMRRQVLEEALAAFKSLRARYARLKELKPLFDVLDRIAGAP